METPTKELAPVDKVLSWLEDYDGDDQLLAEELNIALGDLLGNDLDYEDRWLSVTLTDGTYIEWERK